jgi:hypothetical protein
MTKTKLIDFLESRGWQRNMSHWEHIAHKGEFIAFINDGIVLVKGRLAWAGWVYIAERYLIVADLPETLATEGALTYEWHTLFNERKIRPEFVFKAPLMPSGRSNESCK